MSYKYYGCSGLTSITIPEGVTSIVSSTFLGCSGLTGVHFLSITPPVLERSCFESYTDLYVPDDAIDDYRAAWTQYANQIAKESYSHIVVDVTAKEGSSAVVEAVGEENAENILRLKVKGTINSYDLMVFRNKMIRLRHLDLSEARVVGSSYKYYQSYYSKDNTITGYFAPPTLFSIQLPAGITSLEANAFRECQNLTTVELPEGITSIPNDAFYNCSSLSKMMIPESVTLIGGKAFFGCEKLGSIYLPENLLRISQYAFYSCSALRNVHLPRALQRIEDSAFFGCEKLSSIYLPPYLTTIGDEAFTSYDNWVMESVYAYMPDIIPISTETFSTATYQNGTLYVPEFLYNKYYYDTNWSQFAHIAKTNLSSDDYLTIPTNSDITFADGDERVPDTSEGEHVDGEVGNQGSFTVEGNEPQPFDDVDQNIDGDGSGASLIGEGDTEQDNNMPVNKLKVKIQVKANRWYFFNFPYDVTIAECEYPGQSWIWYDGQQRAETGYGWRTVESATLNAHQGYGFQSSVNGKLIITFEHPTFGGDRPKPLQSYTTGQGNTNIADASWNFVGNPYSSYYEFTESDFSSPFIVWNGTSYVAYRPGDDDYHLQPNQAFFVQKPEGEDEIGFSKGGRETYRQSEAKKANQTKARKARGINPDRLIINLCISDNDTAAIDRTRLVLNERANHAYEMGCDAAKFFSDVAPAQIYMMENAQPMAINERPFSGDLRLGYTAQKAGTLRISAPRMDLPMMLVDTQTGRTFDLSLGTYEFTTAAGTFNQRFMLRPGDEATAIRELTHQTGVAIGMQDGGLSIGGADGKSVSIYSTSGAQMAQHSGNGFVDLASGVYVVKVDGKSAKVLVK